MRGLRRTLGAAVAAAALAAALPGAASAATATVTGDDGNPLELGGSPTIRQMDFNVVPRFTPEEATAERDYTLAILDPAGQLASNRVDCAGARFTPITAFGTYRGNGTYTAVLTTFPDSEDSSQRCRTGGTEQRLAFSVQASTTVGPLPGQFLLRSAGSFERNTLEVPASGNPGADTIELRYARGAKIGPDGGIAGQSEQGFVNRATGRAPITFSSPGRYTFVARVRKDEAFSPWSAPSTVQVKAPFDISLVSFPDSRGPVYRIRVTLRETSARGKVRFALARGRSGKARYRSIGTGRLKRGGAASVRFRQKKLGFYRLRLTYGGSSKVRRGRAVEIVRFRRLF